MYYHFAMLLLFRPLIRYRIIGSEVTPQDVCSQAADAIQALLASYAQLYTLKRTPSFVPYFVLTSTTMKLAVGAAAMRRATPGKAAEIHKGVSQALNATITHLTDMVACHQFAAQALSIVRHLAKEGNFGVESEEEEEIVSEQDHSRGNFYLCSPAVVTRDSVDSVPRLDNAVHQAVRSVQIPLFWPLPIQARATLPEGKALHEAGFEEL